MIILNNIDLRWHAAQITQSKEACAYLKEVVTFSGGWLVDQAEQVRHVFLQSSIK